jgi:hypothetical protein
MFSEDECEHNVPSLRWRRPYERNALPRKQAIARPAFRPMDKTPTVLRGAHPSYTDPADNGAETARNCVFTGAAM